ncbi:MAG: hypothetical protein IKH75_00815 [Ruminococcus sp.]|nr:hypothetical protein [Ruminococcus sp.]
MDTISIEAFMHNPMKFMREAMTGEFVKVDSGNGYKAVIINDTEWTMLSQALKLCVEHPEWTISQ